MRKLFNYFEKIIFTLTVFFHTLSLSASEAGFINPAISTPIQNEEIHNLKNPAVRDAYSIIFADNVFHVSQQAGNYFLPFAQMEGLVRDGKTINRMGSLGDPNVYSVRFSTVDGSNPENDVRLLRAQRYYLATFIDNYDQVRTLFDLRNAYTQAMAMSFARMYDRVCIAALLGSVAVGSNGASTVTLPNSQKTVAFRRDIARNEDGSARSASNQVTEARKTEMNFDTLLDVRTRMKTSFAINRGEMLVWAITARDTQALLLETRISSRDFNPVMVLTAGEISSYLGIAFFESELLPSLDQQVKFNMDTGAVETVADTIPIAQQTGRNAIIATPGQWKRTICFVSGKALCFGINQNMISRIEEVALNHFNWLLYFSAAFGAVRKEEVAVREVLTFDRYAG